MSRFLFAAIPVIVSAVWSAGVFSGARSSPPTTPSHTPRSGREASAPLRMPILEAAPTTTTREIPNGRLTSLRNPAIHPQERSVTVPVLMYHYIRDITPEMTTASRWLSVSPKKFRTQIEELVRFGYHPITPDELVDAIEQGAALPSRPVLLTFDDGYRDQYLEAFPILRELGVKATFFIVSDYRSNPLYVNDEMLREMDRSGLITIAAHTRHHVGLADAKREKRRDEIIGSKRELESLLGHPVTVMAYPYGNFNADVQSLVREAGYRAAFSTLLGSVHTSSSVFELRRIRVLFDESLEPILRKFSSAS